MIWPVFLAALWLMLGLDMGLRGQLQLGPFAAPSLTLVLVTYVAMWAPKLHAIYAAMIAGICLDLLGTYLSPGSTQGITAVGPYALGTVLGAFTVITARAMVERDNLLALPTMSVVLAGLTHLVLVFCLSVRSVYDPMMTFESITELSWRGFSALATGIAAIPLFVVLRLCSRFFGFSPHYGRRLRHW